MPRGDVSRGNIGSPVVRIPIVACPSFEPRVVMSLMKQQGLIGDLHFLDKTPGRTMAALFRHAYAFFIPLFRCSETRHVCDPPVCCAGLRLPSASLAYFLVEHQT